MGGVCRDSRRLANVKCRLAGQSKREDARTQRRRKKRECRANNAKQFTNGGKRRAGLGRNVWFVNGAPEAREAPEEPAVRPGGSDTQSMIGELERESGAKPREPALSGRGWEKEFGYPRNFLNNRFVYVVISPRAHGLSVGINMNPDKKCSFDCAYCEVNRELPPRDQHLDVPVMILELQHTMRLALEGKLREAPQYQTLPAELLELRQVVLSGDGEPTLCPNFREAVQAVAHLRALGKLPFFKLVLVTNGTGLDSPAVQSGLQLFTPKDEVWAKLDGGTPEYIAKINRPKVALAKVLANILALGRQRPIIIQSMFPLYNGEEPSAKEIEQFIARLQALRDGGASIALVQIYSAMRPTMHPECGHLPLRTLSRIAQSVRAGTGLHAEVF